MFDWNLHAYIKLWYMQPLQLQKKVIFFFNPVFHQSLGDIKY